VGRILAAGLAMRISPYFIYGSISLILIGSLLLLDFSRFLLLPFVIAGLGCSAFLPLTVSFGQRQDVRHAEMISGLIMAIYMCGYGIAAYGIGWMQSAFQFPLASLFWVLLIPAVLLAFFVGSAVIGQFTKR